MQFGMLVESKNMPIPDKIKIVRNFGRTTILIPDKSNPNMVPEHLTGDHMALEGTENDIKEWLSSFDGAWITKGSYQLEEFIWMKIKKDA